MKTEDAVNQKTWRSGVITFHNNTDSHSLLRGGTWSSSFMAVSAFAKGRQTIRRALPACPILRKCTRAAHLGLVYKGAH